MILKQILQIKKLMLSLAIAHAQALTITCTNRRVNSILYESIYCHSRNLTFCGPDY